jgi:DNA topoisomerase IB
MLLLYAAEYEPHGVKMVYDGKPVELSPEQEEVASMFAIMKETDYMSKPTFLKNFWEGFQEVRSQRQQQQKQKQQQRHNRSPAGSSRSRSNSSDISELQEGQGQSNNSSKSSCSRREPGVTCQQQ